MLADCLVRNVARGNAHQHITKPSDATSLLKLLAMPPRRCAALPVFTRLPFRWCRLACVQKHPASSYSLQQISSVTAVSAWESVPGKRYDGDRLDYSGRIGG